MCIGASQLILLGWLPYALCFTASLRQVHAPEMLIRIAVSSPTLGITPISLIDDNVFFGRNTYWGQFSCSLAGWSDLWICSTRWASRSHLSQVCSWHINKCSRVAKSIFILGFWSNNIRVVSFNFLVCCDVYLDTLEISTLSYYLRISIALLYLEIFDLRILSTEHFISMRVGLFPRLQVLLITRKLFALLILICFY